MPGPGFDRTGLPPRDFKGHEPLATRGLPERHALGKARENPPRDGAFGAMAGAIVCLSRPTGCVRHARSNTDVGTMRAVSLACWAGRGVA
jgi:hypothetical protein